MNKYRLSIIGSALAILALLSLSAPALAAADGDELLGREVAERGQVISLSGVLVRDGGEWYLDCDGGLYELHMGMRGSLAGDYLVEGAWAEVEGFAIGTDMAPISIASGDILFTAWNADGSPSWAGQGRGRNAQLADSPGRGLYANPPGLNSYGRVDG